MTELVTLPADVEKEVPEITQWAKSLVIREPSHFALTASRLQSIKGVAKRIADFFAPIKKSASETHKKICAREKELLAPVEEAERLAKAAMLTYQTEEENKRRAEQARIQAEADEKARKERHRIDQEAAKQRAIEAEARAKAETARKQAEEATAAERKRLLAQAEAAERKAAAAQAKSETKEQEAVAVVAPVVQVASKQPVVAGLSTRKTWKARIVDLEAFYRYVHEHKRDDLILPNEKVIEAFAKAMGANAKMPGIEFHEVSVMSTRSS